MASGVAAAGQSAPAAGRIDCHSHLFCPELLACSIKRKSSPYAYRKGPDLYVAIQGWHRLVLPKHTAIAAKLADMDAAGIEKDRAQCE